MFLVSTKSKSMKNLEQTSRHAFVSQMVNTGIPYVYLAASRLSVQSFTDCSQKYALGLYLEELETLENVLPFQLLAADARHNICACRFSA